MRQICFVTFEGQVIFVNKTYRKKINIKDDTKLQHPSVEKAQLTRTNSNNKNNKQKTKTKQDFNQCIPQKINFKASKTKIRKKSKNKKRILVAGSGINPASNVNKSFG